MKKVTIKKDRLTRLLSEEFHLRSGKGEGINGGVDACIMQAVDWLAGGDGKTDEPECASPVLTKFCIRLNDSRLFREHRDMLKPFAPKLVNTRNATLDRKRGFVAADYAVRVFTPMRLRFDPKRRFEEHAATLEDLPRIVDKKTAENARIEANKVRGAAYAAADAAA